MQLALSTSKNKIDYINTHGTSTPVGDITELKAVGEVFKDAILEDGNEIEVPWFYPIDNWENLKKFLGSEESNLLARPSKHMLQYKEFNPIGIDNEEE